MEHNLELISPILETVDRTIHIQSYPGNSGSYDPYISPILEIVARTIHICSYVDVAEWQKLGEQSYEPMSTKNI